MTEKPPEPSNVIRANIITRLDTPVETVLQGALAHGLTEVVVIGFDSDGELYTAASMADGGAMLWLLELTKKRLMDIGDG